MQQNFYKEIEIIFKLDLYLRSIDNKGRARQPAVLLNNVVCMIFDRHAEFLSAKWTTEIDMHATWKCVNVNIVCVWIEWLNVQHRWNSENVRCYANKTELPKPDAFVRLSQLTIAQSALYI